MPIFRVKSVKIYTGQKKFTRAPLVVLVTNMRYALACGDDNSKLVEVITVADVDDEDIPDA